MVSFWFPDKSSQSVLEMEEKGLMSCLLLTEDLSMVDGFWGKEN